MRSQPRWCRQDQWQRVVARRALVAVCVAALTWAGASTPFVAPAGVAPQRRLHPQAQTAAAATGGSEPEPERGAAYYAGMFTSPLKEEDLEKDMVTPTLKFVGYSAVAVVGLLFAFLWSNGNVGVDPKSQPLPGF
mmetsp:Transcript_92152/g.206311  ORF Transcript_92152/g.206311 Transcript_92152/m.206311 type:complete len:135 (-) Transcript_92152:178-582(-)